MIRDVGHFHEKLGAAVRLAENGYIVTFGIRPHYPETGYGYIEGAERISENAFSIKRFIEKPDIETAMEYIKAGNFFWNSGMFALKLSVILEEFKKYLPDLLQEMEALFLRREGFTKDNYEKLPEISIDYAIMEKTDKGVVLPSDFGWSDIGSWKSLYDFLPKDNNSNVIDGDVITKDTKNCIIMGYERLIATNQLTNMVVVETPDSVFVSDLDDSRDVKSIVARLKETGRQEYHKHRKGYHPWGTRILLEKKEDFSVERIIIYPGATYAIEADGATLKHLIVTKGQIDVSSVDGSMRLSRGESVFITEKDAGGFENPCHEAVHMLQIDTVV
jgi:mannose-1-phosphate guanylyltransferase/mannose-6-phosphate isomerase